MNRFSVLIALFGLVLHADARAGMPFSGRPILTCANTAKGLKVELFLNEGAYEVKLTKPNPYNPQTPSYFSPGGKIVADLESDVQETYQSPHGDFSLILTCMNEAKPLADTCRSTHVRLDASNGADWDLVDVEDLACTR